MKVVQSVFGKFHHFHLARQLHAREMLSAIFSTYPSWKLADQQIPMDLVRTFPIVHMSWFASQKVQFTRNWLGPKLNRLVADTFDDYVSQRIPSCDVFIGISASGKKTGALVQDRGGKYICDRGSSHARFQNNILRDEFERWGQLYKGETTDDLCRHEAEYEIADVITVPSAFNVRSFLSMGIPADKIKKVSYGADLSRFHKVGDPPTDRFNVLFVGQISFRKGIPYLLEAFRNFKHPNKRLTIVGSVNPDMEAFLKSQELENVELVGSKPSHELKQIMSASHVLVLPSIEEGLAMVQGEALACGCPVICTENTGGEDLFENGIEGFIVPIRDPQAITLRLDQLAEDPQLRSRMSENAINRVQKIGGWDEYGRNYVDVLQHLGGKE